MFKMNFLRNSNDTTTTSSISSPPLSQESSWYLPIGEFIIGRGPKSQINICKTNRNKTISRQHATIRITHGNFTSTNKKSCFKVELHDGVFQKDTNKWKKSASGTFVDNQLLEDWVELTGIQLVKFSTLVVSCI
jgi:pSer/pThr/pTyr-binding forkhead associated (FHA) protein